MDELTCDTCKYRDKYRSEHPCNKCDAHYSKWEHIDEDEGDDK